jgi:uncharacterized Zn-binding protein involved in type VI secretion
MPQISRVGDANEEGGKITRGSSTVFVNGIPVGIHPSPITSHKPWGKHKEATTTDGSLDVFVENCPVLRVTSGNDCGHSIIEGSSDIFIS